MTVSALLPGTSLDQLHDEPVFFHGALDRLPFWKGQALSPQDMILGQGYPLTTYSRVDGKVDTAKLPPDRAWRAFQAGATVESRLDERLIPGVREFYSDIGAELGAPFTLFKILISPAGEGVPMHFDQKDVFILQLRGAKTWKVADPTVAHPLDSHFPSARRQREPGRRPSYFPSDMPTSMQPRCLEVTLKPGSVAYVPSGYWHETRADQLSISLTAAITRETFLNFFVDKLKSEMIRHEVYRRPLAPLGSGGRSAARSQSIRDLLPSALSLVKSLKPPAPPAAPPGEAPAPLVENAVPSEPPGASDHSLHELLWGTSTRQVVATAAHMEIFDVLGESPGGMSLDSLCEKTGYSLRGLRALLSGLAASGFLEVSGGRFLMTDTARTYLVSDSPYYYGSILGPPVPSIEAAVRCGQPSRPFVQRFSRMRSTRATQQFIHTMHTSIFPSAVTLAEVLPVKQEEEILDVGGGSGALSIALALAHPALRARVLELNHVAPLTDGYIRHYGVADRVQVYRMDMWEGSWPKASTVILGNILHDWGEALCDRLLSMAWHALPEGGRIVVHEMLLHEDLSGPIAATQMGLAMLVAERGLQRTFGEYETMLKRAGFGKVEALRTLGEHVAVVGIR